MAILKILQYPDPQLRRKAIKVDDIQSARIQKIIDDMFETLAHTEHCAGLSATQLNIEMPPSITVINAPIAGDEPLCLINPEIISVCGKVTEEEGCMSVYPSEVSAVVERSAQVKFKAYDRTGNLIEVDADDFFARCIQHEIDHLNGILYLDRLSPLKRSRIDKKIKKYLRGEQ